jgi:hypothetical protein
MDIGETNVIRVLRRMYRAMLIACFLLALPFALYLFFVGPPLAVMVFVLGAYTVRWPAAMYVFSTVILVPSFVAAFCMAVILWGENLALGGPFMIWVFDSFLIVTFKLGQLYGHRGVRKRNEKTDRSPHAAAAPAAAATNPAP